MIRAWNQTKLTHRCMRMLASYLAFKSNSWLKAESVEILLEYLGVLESFKANIVDIINTSQPCNSDFVQKLLGFTPEESSTPFDNKFQAVKSSLITHHRVSKFPSSIHGTEINNIVRAQLPNRLSRLLESFHTTALNAPHIQPRSFSSTPAERLPFCTPSTTSTKDCNTKLYILYKILGILNTSEIRSGSDQSDSTTIGHQWLGRVFDITHLATGELERLNLTSNLGSVSTRFRDWFARDWTQLCKSGGIPANSVTRLLLHFLVRSDLQDQISEKSAPWPTPTGTISDYNFNSNLVQPLLELFWGQSFERIDDATKVVRYILDQNDRPDATVMIQFIETLTREIIVHMNPARQPEFDGLLVPLSWARALARRYSGVYRRCDIRRLSDLCTLVQRISMELRFGTPGRWQVARERISATMVDLLNLRMCWCISILTGHMGSRDKDLPLALETLQKLSSDEMPLDSIRCNSTASGTYHDFTEAVDQKTTLVVLCRTFQHERLVLTQESSYRHHPAKFMTGVRTIPCADPTRLIGKPEEVASVPNSGNSSEGPPDSGRILRILGLSRHESDDESDNENGYESSYSHEYRSTYHARNAILSDWH